MVEVAEGDDLLALAAGHVVLAHAADADAGDAEFVARGLVTDAPQHVSRDYHRRRAGGENGTPR